MSEEVIVTPIHLNISYNVAPETTESVKLIKSVLKGSKYYYKVLTEVSNLWAQVHSIREKKRPGYIKHIYCLFILSKR